MPIILLASVGLFNIAMFGIWFVNHGTAADVETMGAIFHSMISAFVVGLLFGLGNRK